MAPALKSGMAMLSVCRYTNQHVTNWTWSPSQDVEELCLGAGKFVQKPSVGDQTPVFMAPAAKSAMAMFSVCPYRNHVQLETHTHKSPLKKLG